MKKIRISPILDGRYIRLPDKSRIVMDTPEAARDLFDSLKDMETRSIKAGQVIGVCAVAGVMYLTYKADDIERWFKQHFGKEEA